MSLQAELEFSTDSKHELLFRSQRVSLGSRLIGPVLHVLHVVDSLLLDLRLFKLLNWLE